MRTIERHGGAVVGGWSVSLVLVCILDTDPESELELEKSKWGKLSDLLKSFVYLFYHVGEILDRIFIFIVEMSLFIYTSERGRFGGASERERRDERDLNVIMAQAFRKKMK